MNNIRGDRGFTVMLALVIILSIATLGAASVYLTSSVQSGSVAALRSNADYYAAQSGLEFIRQATHGFTTANAAQWKSFDGTIVEFNGAGGPRFTLSVAYLDADNNPATADTVTITSTGSIGVLTVASSKHSVQISLTVPPPSTTAYLNDDFTQGGVAAFDSAYTAGAPTSAHGAMSPFTTVANIANGDTANIITHPSEPGGPAGILRMGGATEARFTIYSGSCFKWASSAFGNPCGYGACVSQGACNARQGLNIPPDAAGFQNYFIKIRFRALSGSGGFGVYFRSSYPNAVNPYTVNFGGLTGYLWQYDPYLGYIAPCTASTAILGSDSVGMFAARRINFGLEACPIGCEVITTPGPDMYPYFCPENRTGLGALDGWLWSNADWFNRWRTVYIYVFQSTASVYVGREEIVGTGSEIQPVKVETIPLDSIGGLLSTGDIGLRTWGGTFVDIDYIQIFPNDLNYNPATFGG